MPEHRFRLGERVRVKTAHPSGNPRTPGYVRGQVGEVVKLHGQMDNPLDHRDVYPPLCTVAFRAGVDHRDRLYVDLHEDWLAPA